ncbi:hypothetical protein AAC387_Pa02g1950 [Persea americana]
MYVYHRSRARIPVRGRDKSLETGEYLFDEEWIPESHLMPVIWYNPLQPQGSWSDDEEVQEAVQENAANPALTNTPVEPNNIEPRRADEDEDLDPMPDLEEYAMILQHLAIEQEHDRINQLRHNPKSKIPENSEKSRKTSPQSPQSSGREDSASEALSAEVANSQTTSGSISSEATSSRVTSTEISSSQPSSLETMYSEFKPLSTDHHGEALADDVLKENPDLFPENAPCNAITEDGNAAAETFSANEKDQPLDLEGDLPNEEPSPEALEVGRGTRSGWDYHKNYNQSSSSYVNPSGKQAVNAPSGNNKENTGPKEAFKYDLIEHFKHIPAQLHILDLLRMSP